ncbi:ribosome maturation factor RimM [Muricoccus radiodurans]|uniref:ribosome maturation factor RimM n=1 Tax=Muricoccus radiodurans TaxID=2231721 RepID=UPI003CE6BD1B
MSAPRRILVGEFGRPHGVRGLIHVRSHTAEPAAIAGYGPLLDEGGTRHFVLQWLADGLVRVEGVTDRDAAARLTGTKLYVERDSLPATEEDEFYLTDLIGLRAVAEDGADLGTVSAVEDFGAGSVLTLRDGAGRETLIPFTRAVVPVVDVAGGRITVVPPDSIEVPPQPGEAEASSDPLPRRAPLRRRSGGRDAA